MRIKCLDQEFTKFCRPIIGLGGFTFSQIKV